MLDAPAKLDLLEWVFELLPAAHIPAVVLNCFEAQIVDGYFHIFLMTIGIHINTKFNSILI